MKRKKEKGSIAIFVLLGLLFMGSFLLISYTTILNKSKTVQGQFNTISSIYQYSDEGLDSILNSKHDDTQDTESPGSNSTLKVFYIGTAINSEYYGYKVAGYDVKATIDENTNSGVWRLFYQDQNYTYLITDDLIGNYKPSEYYSDYVDGSYVGDVGRALNPIVNEFFTESYKWNSIRTTAWLTSREYWKNYCNEDAVFAIASPTLELFKSSYNATNEDYTMTVRGGTYGYILSVASNLDNSSITSEYLSKSGTHGIYYKSSSDNWWISSPGGNNSMLGMLFEWAVVGSSGSIKGERITSVSHPIRPLVCIPTTIFNEKYFSSIDLNE